MISLKLAKFGFILLFVILYTKAYSIIKEKMEQFNELLQYSGWRNLNELIYIKYINRTYYLQNLIEITTNTNKCKQKIRCLTIYLGCTYAIIMNTLFLINNKLIKICKYKLEEEKDLINGCICTEELIKIVSLFIVPLAILFKGAMDALDLLHIHPWAYNKSPYMISPRLGKIENILNDLNEIILSHDDISTYIWTLNTVDNFFDDIMKHQNYDVDEYCEFITYDKNYLWKKWNQEYKTSIGHDINLVFFKFLTKKIEDYIHTIIIQKYSQLGFKFDPITQETFIPKSDDLIEPELEFKITDE
ncbi:uncharacterized protein LOC126908165 [Daktulosphaira vitifoliae]|uniref:uncharacterized protein LOC126908165 n=1 Tax=Daktulosphaira vitifoliae TaxID=58002 RepID=UPI0021AA5181|nr:uncharacterized protein LOC126908165 [Daktulosphaira vitifoliae]XP_050546035.1 uncharacterized protein LOC126908165 [Daktulosphaira vitifoliae]XP_050546036.1 uncharacterized protein LOC126908165 [Daktulosphaira vitifoliae]